MNSPSQDSELTPGEGALTTPSATRSDCSTMIDAIHTPRLWLRRWEPSDATLLKEAIDSSLADLQTWVDWTLEHPMPVAKLESQLAMMRDRFATREDWTFGIFDLKGTQLLGGAGVHPRGTRDRVELGYWLRSDATGQGFAQEAAAALCTAAFALPEVTRIDILCDAHNTRSAAVAQRLGFSLAETFPQHLVTSRGTQRDTQRWTKLRDESQRDRPTPATADVTFVVTISSY